MLEEELREVLTARGADMIGFGALKGVPGAPLPNGVAVAVRIPREVLRDIRQGPTKRYYDCYQVLNERLNGIVLAGERFLRERGFAARALSTDRVTQSDDARTALPHKTVAVRAGLGWIGKCALLVTEAYGSAVRISSLVTDAPLVCGVPVLPRCGGCARCEQYCPAGAVRGRAWENGTDRDELVDIAACRRQMLQMTRESFGVATTICGQCMVHCPFTNRYAETGKMERAVSRGAESAGES